MYEHEQGYIKIGVFSNEETLFSFLDELQYVFKNEGVLQITNFLLTFHPIRKQTDIVDLTFHKKVVFQEDKCAIVEARLHIENTKEIEIQWKTASNHVVKIQGTIQQGDEFIHNMDELYILIGKENSSYFYPKIISTLRKIL